MRITVPYSAFASAFKLAASVTARGGSMPVMQEVRIRAFADANLVELTATDFENRLDIQLAGATVEVGGTAMLDPGAVRAALAAGKGADSVTISADGQFSKIKIGGQTIRASELDAAMFLDPQTLGPAIGNIQCETALLAYGLKTALFAVSDDAGRPNLTGVCLEADGGRLTMICTDGHRLGKSAFPAAISTTEERLSIIVPGRGAALIQDIITGLDTEITVHRADVLEDVQVTTPALGNRGQITLRVRLINASFPDYNRVIPAPNPDKTIIVAASDLCEAVQVICKTDISLAKQKNSKAMVKMETDYRKPGLKLWSAHAQESSPDDFQLAVISSDERHSGAVSLGFNPTYWLDLCKVIEEPSYSLQLIDGMSPVVIRPTEEPADLDTLLVVMPMRI